MEATLGAEIIQPTEKPLVQVALPVTKNDRILFLDCLRGMALLGILIMNIMAQSQPHQFYDNMNLNQPLTGPNFYVWFAERFFFEGTMRGIFSILFGAGTVLLLLKLQKQKQGLAPADIFYRRMLWLLIFGLINAFVFLWPGDILYPYAVAGLLLFPFRNWSPKNLIWGALFFLAIATYRENTRLRDDKEAIAKGPMIEKLDEAKKPVTDDQKQILGRWKNLKEEATSEGMMKTAEKELKRVQGKNYLQIFRFFRDVNMSRQSVGLYNFMLWDALIFFFIGMSVYKSGFLLGKAKTWVYLLVGVIGIAAAFTVNYVDLRQVYHDRFDYIKYAEKASFSYYEIRRVFQTIGYLSLLVVLYKLIPFKKIMNIFAPVGQMAFTNYLVQSIITSVVFYGFGFYGKLQRFEIYYVLAAIWVFQIIISFVWLRYFAFGPFEWVWRSLTYRKAQPWRKRSEQEVLQKSPLTAGKYEWSKE